MARKKVECITCDRCKKVIEEIADGAEPSVSDDDPCALTLESPHGNITFEDLCDKCDKRVADLIKQLQIPPKEDKEKSAKGKNAKNAKDDKKAAPPAAKKDAKKDKGSKPKPPAETNDFA